MKTRFCLLLWLGLIAAAACQSEPVHQAPPLKATTPDATGLTWRECVLSEGYDPMQAEVCFGQPVPLWNQDAREKANFGERIESDNFRLTIGLDTYYTTFQDSLLPMQDCFTLHRGDTRLQTLCGQSTSHSPNILLQNINGKAAWEFADHRQDTVIYDGQDLRRVYELDAAYRPYPLGNKLIFVGKKDGKYFVVYDGVKVGPDFDEIVIAYCCEPVLWSIHFGQGRYVFWGSREGRTYVVEVTTKK